MNYVATFPLLNAMVIALVAGALIIGFAPALRGYAKQLGLVFSLSALAASVAMLANFDFANPTAIQLKETVSWIPQLGVSWAMGINGLGAAMIIMTAALVPLVQIAAWREQEGRENRAKREANFTALVLSLEAIVIALFAARDLFMFYVLFEAMLLPVYFLIGGYGGPGRKRAAIKFLLYSLAGGLIMLVGVVAAGIYGAGGPETYMIDSLSNGLELSASASKLVFFSFLIAFAIKAPMVPVHTWLPDTAQQATPGTSTLLVGVLDKVGTFGMITIVWQIFPQESRWAAPGIIGFAAASIIWGGLMAISSKDIMRLIAYTSVSHFGFIVIGIYAGNEIGFAGAAVYMVAHGVSTAAMFLIAGFLAARGGTQEIAAYGGMRLVTPVIAGTFLVAGLASISLPGLSGFVPEVMVLLGAFKYSPWIGAIAVFGVILAALYLLLPYKAIFTGPKQEKLAGIEDMRGYEKLVVVPLIAAMLAIGFYPGPLTKFVGDNQVPAADTTSQVVNNDSKGSDK